MSREEYDALLNRDGPSAPLLPFTSAHNIRVVQPFEIAAEVAEEMYAEAEAVAASSQTRTNKSSAILNAGKKETRELEAKIARGNIDGRNILYNDSDVTHSSNYTGFSEHHDIRRKVAMSQSDNVHELGASLPLPAVAVATMCTSNSAVEEKLKEMEKKNAEPSGYQFTDYTSTYEFGGGYKGQDYKSIYDK